MGEDLKKAVEEALELPVDQLKENLIPLLNGIKEFGVAQLIELVPDLVPKLINKLKNVDVIKFVKEAPEASAKFMDLLWEGISVMVEKNPDIKEALKKAGEVSVNFEAIDSPMKGHLKISEGKLSGGGYPLANADMTIKGYTKSLIGVLVGEIDPTEAFFKQVIKMEGGSIPLGMKVSSAMMEVAELFKQGK